MRTAHGRPAPRPAGGQPYYLGGEIKDRSSLNIHTPATLKARLNLDVRVRTEVVGIDQDNKTVRARELVTCREYDEPYDELVLSLGAKPFIPPIPGIQRPGALALRSLEDMDAIDNWIKHAEAQTAVVAGGGFIGVEMAEQLHRRGLKVTLVEAMPQLMGPFDPEMAALIHAELERHGVRVEVGKPIKAFHDKAGAKCCAVDLGEGLVIDADLVILSLGVRPDSALPKAAGLEVTPRGGIVVDDRMRTSGPHIWAVGDAVQVRNPIAGGEWMVALAGPANRQGRLCADNIYGADKAYKGTFGTSAVRVFDLTAACTGLNERGLAMAKIPFDVVHIHPNSHASYYPGAEPIALKLLFGTEGSRRGAVLGAQALGKDGADKRIDVLATAIQGGLTVDDVAELELCYAPPVGSAKDPVNFAGMVAQNVLAGLVHTVQWKDVASLAESPDYVIIDVRTASELKAKGAIHPNALHVPLDDLRVRIHEVPSDRKIVVSCFSGQRSYYAARILAQHGFDVLNLDGAFKTLVAAPNAPPAKAGGA